MEVKGGRRGAGIVLAGRILATVGTDGSVRASPSPGGCTVGATWMWGRLPESSSWTKNSLVRFAVQADPTLRNPR